MAKKWVVDFGVRGGEPCRHQRITVRGKKAAVELANAVSRLLLDSDSRTSFERQRNIVAQSWTSSEHYVGIQPEDAWKGLER